MDVLTQQLYQQQDNFIRILNITLILGIETFNYHNSNCNHM
jgi:hypothetical protein